MPPAGRGKGNGKGRPAPGQQQQQQRKKQGGGKKGKNGARTQNGNGNSQQQRGARKGKGGQGAGRQNAGNMLSFQSSANVPTIVQTGNAYPIRGVIRSGLALLTSPENFTRTLICVTNTGISGTAMATLQSDGILVTQTAYTIPLLAAADSAGGPTSGRAMKSGVHIINTSPFLNKGGRVYVLKCTARVRMGQSVVGLTVANFNTLFNTLVAHPDTIQAGGEDFGGKGKMINNHVVDVQKYEDFAEWNGTQTVVDFFAHVAVWPLLVTKDRPMSSIWVLIETPPAAQTYSVDAHSAFYTRWSVDTVVGQNMVPIPTAPADVLNAALRGSKGGTR